MIALAAALLLQAASERDVVVTAQPPAATERTLKECLARGCPPDEEIAAALAHAENQFVAGDYAASTRTLQRTIDRVRGSAGDYPVSVGDILRAKGRIIEHLGFPEVAQGAQTGSLDALRQGLGADDARVLVQRIEVADTLAKMGKFEVAEGIYNSVARQARKTGRGALEGRALMRTAAMWTSLATSDPPLSEYALRRGRARTALARIGRTTDPALAPFREAAMLLAARLDGRPENAVLDRLVAGVRTPASATPTLISAPPYVTGGLGGRAVAAAKVGAVGFDGQWIDIGFRIKPDGFVDQVELLRASPGAQRFWIELTLRQTRGRRYAPLDLPADAPGRFQVERVTMTSDYIPARKRSGSPIPIRSGTPRFVTTDLSTG